MRLNQRQRAFAEHVAAGENFTAAAKLAGYSAKTAKQKGSQMAKNLKIAREIERLREGAPSVFQVQPPPPPKLKRAPKTKPIAPPPENLQSIPNSRGSRAELRAAVAALPPDDLGARRAWLLETFVELAAQRENLSIALKSAEWLAAAYRLRASVTDAIEVQDRTADDLAGGIDLETAQAIRAAAGKAA